MKNKLKLFWEKYWNKPHREIEKKLKKGKIIIWVIAIFSILFSYNLVRSFNIPRVFQLFFCYIYSYLICMLGFKYVNELVKRKV
jgi:hypothetical protein